MESILGGDDEGIPLATQAILIKQLEEERIAKVSQAAIDALPAGREKQMVIAIDTLLSYNLGSADGYLGSIGLPVTRRLQRALAEYGITPDYGQSIGCGFRSISRA
jgi:hypothetical protein